MMETEKRRDRGYLTDILKTISYRFIGSFITFMIGYLGTSDYKIGVGMGAADLLVKPLVYFFHERLWRKIQSK